MSDDQADGSWLSQSQHRNDAVVSTVFSMDVKIALMRKAHIMFESMLILQPGLHII